MFFFNFTGIENIKMKLALVLTGHMRCWDQVFSNTLEKIISKHETDVFIHTWKDQAWWDPHSKEGIATGTPKIDFDSVIKNYNPISIVVQDFEEYKQDLEKQSEIYTNHHHVRKNIISMFYKLSQGVSLMEEYTMRTGNQYDLVIRMRPDMIFNEDLPNFDPNFFYTIAHKNHLGQGTGDTFQASNPFIISLFSKILMIMPQIYSETKILCPHIVSEHFIKKFGLNWKEFDIKRTLMHTPLGPYVPKQNYMR